MISERGFRTGEAKDSWFAGEYEWAVEVPDGVRARAKLSADRGRHEPVAEPLRITHAGRGEREFVTDRGPAVLPAYWLRGPATAGALWALDPSIDYWVPPEVAGGAAPPAPTGRQPMLWPIETGVDWQSLVIPWLGSSPEVETFPSVTLVETSTAVSAVAIRKDMGFRGWATSAGVKHCVAACLQNPLGDRVFVNLHGDPLPVMTAPDIAALEDR